MAGAAIADDEERLSRYLLACEALRSTALAGVWPVCERVFREYGLPQAIKVTTECRLRRRTLSAGLVASASGYEAGGAAGPRHAGPSRSKRRARRMHRELKKETTRPPERDRRAQQQRFDVFRQVSGPDPPHGASAQTPPARHFTHTRHPYPERPASSRIHRTSRSGRSPVVARSTSIATRGSSATPSRANLWPWKPSMRGCGRFNSNASNWGLDERDGLELIAGNVKGGPGPFCSVGSRLNGVD